MREKKHCCGFMPSPADGAFAVVAAGGHGHCCCGHSTALRGFHHSIRYQGVLGGKGKKRQDACFPFYPQCCQIHMVPVECGLEEGVCHHQQ